MKQFSKKPKLNLLLFQKWMGPHFAGLLASGCRRGTSTWETALGSLTACPGLWRDFEPTNAPKFRETRG